MKRILFSTFYGQNDIANFNCAMGPFSQLRSHVEIVTPTPLFVSWEMTIKSQWWMDFKWWLGIDAVFVHRPSGWYGKQIIEAAKTHHVPIWVHHDDDLLAVPETNPYYQAIVLQDKEHPSVELSYKEADILTCQSVLMKKMLEEKYGRSDVILLPIALDDRLIHLKKPFSNNNRVCWRGSSSHKHDLLSYKSELQEIFNKHEDKEFHFFVLNPRELGLKVKNLTVYEPSGIFTFYNRITEINAAYHLVLLEDNHFNRVKSHLAWIDGTLAGSIVQAPMYEEFDRPGCLNFNPNNVLQIYPASEGSLNETSWETIKDCYLNSIVNSKRLEIIDNL